MVASSGCSTRRFPADPTFEVVGLDDVPLCAGGVVVMDSDTRLLGVKRSYFGMRVDPDAFSSSYREGVTVVTPARCLASATMRPSATR